MSSLEKCLFRSSTLFFFFFSCNPQIQPFFKKKQQRPIGKWYYKSEQHLNYQRTFTTYYSIQWRRQWHPTPLLLPGESHGRRSLVGCSQWGCEESDTTERLHFHFSFSCIGEGNGNPLQCSCLENPRDGTAWWAAIYGVAQNQTRLKRLGSSSSPC